MRKLLTILLLACIQSAFSDEYIENDYRLDFYTADAYARAVKIDVLLSGGNNELRLWAEDGESGNTSGHILTEKTSKICKTSLHTKDANLYVIKSGSCKSNKVAFSTEEFMSVLEKVSTFDKKKIECKNLMDGWGGDLEGVFNGKRFSISLYNPDACEESDAVAITKLLNKIGL